jgi:hypothetical protein
VFPVTASKRSTWNYGNKQTYGLTPNVPTVDFIGEVQAQTGKAITVAQANQLIGLANQARAGLGCS